MMFNNLYDLSGDLSKQVGFRDGPDIRVANLPDIWLENICRISGQKKQIRPMSMSEMTSRIISFFSMIA